MNALVLFAKFPEPGRVKKCIGKAIGMENSAGLCRAFINDLIEENQDKDYDLYLSFIGHEHKEQYRSMFPNAILYVQRGSNLSDNLQFTFEDLLDDYEKVVVLSCDVPQLSSQTVVKAFNALDSYEVVLGPAQDGGYYIIGMKKPQAIFEMMPWGTEDLLKAQMENLRKKGLPFVLLEKMYDVDTMEELRHLKETLTEGEAPRTFAFLHRPDIKI
ncbi:MAG: TIGR04282 family arsenosugar biosynthesis glycosyltransferase [Candidatus Woesearchaeota archaeon]